jgi:large subunit ribosomal protein L24
MANKIRKGDEVIVIAGDSRGKRGRVIEIYLENQKPRKVKVEGVNLQSVLTKPTRDNPKKERTQREAWVDVSNVALCDPVSGKATRVSFLSGADGKKERVAKASGRPIPAPAF